tara:strand:- start:25 stop:309 length:285 start_codon:yes stop_codon:yes gene_type:complete
MSCKKFSFNSIANIVSIVSGVSLAGIIGVGSYVYVNKDAIIEDIKEAAIESVMGGMGGSLGGSALPIGAPDLASPTPQASAPSVPSAGLGVANF